MGSVLWSAEYRVRRAREELLAAERELRRLKRLPQDEADTERRATRDGEILRLYAEGYLPASVARLVGVSAPTVVKVLKASSVYRSTKLPASERIERDRAI